MASAVGQESLVFAVDSKRGKVATHGWQKRTDISPVEMIQKLEDWCDAFLYIHIDTEGMMQGFPLEVIRQLRAVAQVRLIRWRNY